MRVAAGHANSRLLRHMPAVLAAAILLALVPLVSKLMPIEVYSTRTAEVRDLVLPDGSRVILSASSRIELGFKGRARFVRLSSGEAYFEVAQDPARLFVVDAGAATVRVLGTRFSVRRGIQQVSVAVLKGRVEVLSSTQPGQVLTAGQQVTIDVGLPVPK